jgi:hypothetical protein
VGRGVDGGRDVTPSKQQDPNYWTGRIAFILALSIGVALTAAIIIVALSPTPLDTAFGSVITTLAGAAVGAVATYLGTTVAPRRDAEVPAVEAPPEAEAGPDAVQDTPPL